MLQVVERMGMEPSRKIVLDAVSGIEPFDDLERQHQSDVIAWIKSGAPIFRVAKPDKPPRHLVSYFVLVDLAESSMLLVDHRNAELLLPTGGHIEPNEDPRATVEREAIEELGIPAKFTTPVGNKPIFITSTATVGRTAGHTDVSLWYVLEGSKTDKLDYDEREFAGMRWLTFDEVLAIDQTKLDPQMHRFVRKLRTVLRTSGMTV